MSLSEQDRIQITTELLGQIKGLVAAIYRKIIGLKIIPRLIFLSSGNAMRGSLHEQ